MPSLIFVSLGTDKGWRTHSIYSTVSTLLGFSRLWWGRIIFGFNLNMISQSIWVLVFSRCYFLNRIFTNGEKILFLTSQNKVKVDFWFLMFILLFNNVAWMVILFILYLYCLFLSSILVWIYWSNGWGNRDTLTCECTYNVRKEKYVCTIFAVLIHLYVNSLINGFHNLMVLWSSYFCIHGGEIKGKTVSKSAP